MLLHYFVEIGKAVKKVERQMFVKGRSRLVEICSQHLPNSAATNNAHNADGLTQQTLNWAICDGVATHRNIIWFTLLVSS
jgi:K+-transporting ATPase A subunit